MMKKTFLILTFLSFLIFPLLSKSPDSKKNIRHVKTQWFDIIYPEVCQETARLFYQNADEIYDQVTAQYGITPQFKMPLVITPSVEDFNAYWTCAPYNHIVIYDTSISGVDELNVFSETLLSVFRHELTHAVTYNMKNPFWNGVTKIFGDPAVLGMLSISSGMAEGATVASESTGGEGRLNDEYAKHYVKQAKLEGKFPSYYDVIGSGDKVPTGDYYYFNGAFHQWLQENYGMQAYADFWYNLVNVKRLTVEGAFKKAFGIKLKKAWKAFEASYRVPEISGNPLQTNLVSDFFDSNSQKYSILNNAGSYYHSLTASDKWIAWIDSYGSKIQYVEIGDLGNGSWTAGKNAPGGENSASGGEIAPGGQNPKIKPKTLFSFSGLAKIHLSKDGRFMAISYYTESTFGAKAKVAIYDTETKKTFKVKEASLKDSAIIQASGNYYLVADKYASSQDNIFIAKLDFDENGRISGLSDEKIISQGQNILHSDFEQVGADCFACIKKSGLDFSICIYDLSGQIFAEYQMPHEKMAIRSLSVYGDDLYFSWASTGTMPRLGKLSLFSGDFCLSDQDFSGGIYEPLCLGDRILYVGKFYRQNRLLVLNDDVAVVGKGNAPVGDGEVLVGQENALVGKSAGLKLPAPVPGDGTSPVSKSPLSQSKSLSSSSENPLPASPYNPFFYLTRGIFLPASLYTTSYFGCNSAYSSETSNYPLGLTYITTSPWASLSSTYFTATAGWNYLNNACGFQLSYQNGGSSSYFSSSGVLKTEFDRKGWKLSYADYALTATFPVGRISHISFSNEVKGGIGRQDARNKNLTVFDEFAFWNSNLFGVAAPATDTIYYTVSDTLIASYTNVHRAGPGRFEKIGFSFATGLGYRNDKSIKISPVTYVDEIALTAALRVYLPRLLPFECNYGYTYNLPTRFDISYFPSSSINGYTKNTGDTGRVISDIKSETVIFGLEIQKALPFFSWIYLNDFYVSLGYAATFGAGKSTKIGFQPFYVLEYLQEIKKGDGTFYDSVYLKTSMELTPNIGVFANSNFKMNVYALFAYAFHKSYLLKSNFAWTMGLQASF